MIPLVDARARVLRDCERLPVERVPLSDALGLVAGSDVVSVEAVPPFANTAMDGFAVVAADTVGASEAEPVRLSVVGTVAAGDRAEVSAGPGEAVRIMTGAPIPEGADAVVMVERTRSVEAGAVVEVQVEVAPGTHIRPAGDDIEPGDLVLAAGTELCPGHLGLLAGLGHLEVEVIRRPRVGVLSTGDELVEGARPLEPGEIRDSNRHALLALVRELGCEAVDLGVIPDDEAAIARAIESGVESCDAIVTSGGVSMGDFDYVKVVLDRMGEMEWMQVAIKPAKPLAFGTVRGVPVFGLPGNPVSSMISFELFTRPALRRMMGHDSAGRLVVTALCDEGFARRADGKLHFLRAKVSYGEDGLFHVRSAGRQGSHQLSAMAEASALAVLPDGEGVPPGGTVDAIVVGPLA